MSQFANFIFLILHLLSVLITEFFSHPKFCIQVPHLPHPSPSPAKEATVAAEEWVRTERVREVEEYEARKALGGHISWGCVAILRILPVNLSETHHHWKV